MSALLKKVLPTPAYAALRGSWYAAQRLRFYKAWWAGLRFDLFQRQYRTEEMVFDIPMDLTTRIHRARFFHDSHEREERILLKKYVPAAATVLELGACLGVVSAVINRRLSNPKAHVAVEANPNLIGILERNRDQNGCQFTIASGMVSKTSDGSFYLDDCIVVSGPVVESARRIKVPVFSIEDLGARYNLKFDTLFMDIQGGERALLEEHAGLLRDFKLVILELHPHLMGKQAAAECRTYLKEAGLENIETMGLIEVWRRPGA